MCNFDYTKQELLNFNKGLKMKIIEERQFDYIPDKVFKNLSKRDRDNLRSYRGTYRWYKDNDDKIKSLEEEITKRKEK